MPLLVLAALAGCGGSDDGPGPRTIGVLRSVPGVTGEQAFLAVLARAGYDDVTLLGAKPDEVHPTAADAAATAKRWVARGADLILALSSSGALAAAEAVPETPVLFISTDPTGTGLVQDPRRPEANRTGVSYRVPSDRTLAVAEDALGDLRRIGCIYADADVAAKPPVDDLRRGARSLGIEVECVPFHDGTDVAAAIEQLATRSVDAIVVPSSPTTSRAYPQIAAAVGGISIPVITGTAAAFAVLTLQPDSDAIYQQLGRQAVRLFRGAQVKEVPVEDPGRYLLVIDERVARRIGRTIPAEVLARADRVLR